MWERTRKIMDTSDRHEFEWLRTLAPEFGIDGSKIEILDTPTNFHSKLVKEVGTAKKRIVLAALYLGTGTLEKELVDCIRAAVKRSEELQIDILLDYVRGSRGQENSRTVLKPLMDLCENSQNLSIYLYHTPNLRGVLKRYLPARWNEMMGVAHLKSFIFDDTMVISGANLSNDYFVDRQDRYMVFNECPELADYFHKVINTISRFSFKLLPSGNVSLNRQCRNHPFQGPFDEFAKDVHTSVQSLIESSVPPEGRRILKAENKSNDAQGGLFAKILKYPVSLFKSTFGYSVLEEDTDDAEKKDIHILEKVHVSSPTSLDSKKHDTWVYPTIQMGLFGIRQDEIITEALMQSFPQGSKVSFTTGYFNVTDKYCDVMVKNAANYDILLSSPECNGFFGSRGFGGYVPSVYAHLCKNFHKKVVDSRRSDDFALFEYIRNGWTFHGKGLWYYPPGESLPNISLIGSSNFGLRSVTRDLEAQVIVVTKNEKLKMKLHDEKQNLMRFTRPITIDTLRRPRYHVPRWVAVVTYFIKSYF